MDQGLSTQDGVQKNAGTAAEAPPVKPDTNLWSRLAERIPLRILAADDVRTNRELLRRLTAYFGYDSEIVGNGAEVLAVMAQRSFDLLFLDVQMPVMDGLEAAREIIRLHPDPGQRPKIVAITANSLEADREVCRAAGMDDCLEKPFSPRAFESCIIRLFADPSSARMPGPDAVRPGRPAQPPLVDFMHLDAAIPGLTNAQRLEMRQRMHRAGAKDFEAIWPRLIEAVSRRDQNQLAEALHGLKGCFSALGWTRIADCCTEALERARRRQFTEWLTLPGELQQLHAESSAEMKRSLDAMDAPSYPPAPGDATRGEISH